MLLNQLFENITATKQEILNTINSIDTNIEDPELAKQNEELLDKIYTILNKNNVLDRIGAVLPNTLKGEYSDNEVIEIAGAIADAPLRYRDKIDFAKNLASNKVINSGLLLKPGGYSIDDLTYNNSANKIVFDHLKGYGVGKLMKGPAEHALAILSTDISIQGVGDVTVGSTPVEIKAATSNKKGGGGGRFGETGRLPSRSAMVKLITSIPPLKEPVEEFLKKQQSMNVETFVNIVNSIELTPEQRESVGENVFGAIFGDSAKRVIDAFAKPNVEPDLVRRAYIKSNYDWYKNSDMGGEWKLLAAISFADNAMGVMQNADDIDKITVYKKNPAIITTDKPQEMLFQFNPKL